MVTKSLSLGVFSALIALAGSTQPALAQGYVTQSQALDKLVDVDTACLAVATNYIPNSSCKTQDYLVEFSSEVNQSFVELSEVSSLEQSFDVVTVSAFELNGFELADLARDPKVKSISANSEVSVAATQNPAPWHLDRMDQANLPLTSTYGYQDNAQGLGVRVYIVDTGINQSHTEFTGRIAAGYSSVGANTSDTLDCNGHGTHVAALAAGSTYGSAKQATIVPVRVLDCSGNGTLLSVLMGLDWVARNTQVGSQAVVNMSLGGDPNTYLDNAVANLTDQGLAFVVAAGNTGTDACSTSPARVPGAITVASSSRRDGWPSYSNFGSCVDIIAPGDEITSAWIGSPSALMGASGTSMAAGVVSGIIATQLSYGYQTPAALSDAIKNNAAAGKVTSVPSGTANLLVQNTIAFASPGAANGTQTTIQVPQDQTPVSIVDPITQPSPSTPVVELPVTYGKPEVTVTQTTANVTWNIPQMSAPLTGQVMQIMTGTTVLAQVEIGATATSYQLINLVTGVVYRVQVAGVNTSGMGQFSELSDGFSFGGLVVDGPEGGELTTWAKRISGTQVKLYAKFPQLNQKIEFFAQQEDGRYKSIGWMRITPDKIDENGEYIGLTNGVYFVRTFNLREGKNRLKIYVDGQQVGATKTYTR